MCDLSLTVDETRCDGLGLRESGCFVSESGSIFKILRKNFALCFIFCAILHFISQQQNDVKMRLTLSPLN